ncbi:MAG: penicillin-binding transpeptidase domain-containing protein [Actinomycetota bacterium]
MAEGRRPSFVTIAAGLVFMLGLGATAATFLGPAVFPQGDVPETTTTETTIPVDEAAAEAAATAFAAALTTGDVTTVEYASTTGAEAAADFATTTDGLAPFTLQVESGTVSMTESGLARVPLTVTWNFPETSPWVTETTVAVQELGGRWLVRWDVSALESSLLRGDRLQRTRIPSARAELLGRDGSVLVSEASFVRIGIRPSRVDDLPTLVSQLQALLPIDPDDLAARVTAADPDDFVEVTALPRAEYEAIREQVFPLPGTVFREEIRPVAGSSELARALLGSSGEVTAEILEENPGLFAAGDFAGLSGLQREYNAELTGLPGARISVFRAPFDPSSTTTGTGLTTTSALRDPTLAEELATVEPTPGQQVITTIDPAIQAAAEAALSTRTETSALVAIEVSTGEVVAVANSGPNSTVNFAMTGQYPPGSIFKMVTAYAAMERGLGAEQSIDCPQTITIQGRPFGNAGGSAFGVIPLRTAFAVSCNTAFINASSGFGPTVLTDTSALFGIGDDTPVGAPVFSGFVPETPSGQELAEVSFGQGQILMSPFSAAVMAATAAGGVYRSPRLVTAPSPGEQQVIQLSPGPAADLQSIMRSVVTNGTGTALLGVPGAPVAGKSGSAQFDDTDGVVRAHAWFVGFQGNIAFAVLVERGEAGGGVAGPVAANFLSRIGSPASQPTPSTTAPEENPSTTVPEETTTTADG